MTPPPLAALSPTSVAAIATGIAAVIVALIGYWGRSSETRSDRADRLAERVGDESTEIRRELRAENTALRQERDKAVLALAELASEHEQLKFRYGLLLTQTDETGNPDGGS